MSDAPKRRLLDQLGPSPTFIAEGSSLVGDLEVNGHLLVCGTVRGNATVAGPLRLAATAVWTGDIRARQGVIAGRVAGRIFIEERLEISATARITGEVSARSIAIARGAVIDGRVTVASGEQVIVFEEKRQDS